MSGWPPVHSSFPILLPLIYTLRHRHHLALELSLLWGCLLSSLHYHACRDLVVCLFTYINAWRMDYLFAVTSTAAILLFVANFRPYWLRVVTVLQIQLVMTGLLWAEVFTKAPKERVLVAMALGGLLGLGILLDLRFGRGLGNGRWSKPDLFNGILLGSVALGIWAIQHALMGDHPEVYAPLHSFWHLFMALSGTALLRSKEVPEVKGFLTGSGAGRVIFPMKDCWIDLFHYSLRLLHSSITSRRFIGCSRNNSYSNRGSLNRSPRA